MSVFIRLVQDFGVLMLMLVFIVMVIVVVCWLREKAEEDE